MIRPNLSVFISYADRDQKDLDEFSVHLSGLERLGMIQVWHPGKIAIGADRDAIIEAQLLKADIILFFLSPYFIADKETWPQLERALELKAEKEIWLAKVYLRICHWEDHKILSSFPILPKNNKPIKSHLSVDEAYTNVVEELATAIRNNFPEIAPTKKVTLPPISESGKKKQKTTSAAFQKLFSVNLSDYYAIQNESRQMITEAIYKTVHDKSKEGLMGVNRRGKWGFVNYRGKEVISPKYAATRTFSEGFAAVSNGIKWGFINRQGKEVIPFAYDGTGDFSEGFAAVVLNGKVGFINTKGRLQIPAKYQSVNSFGEGLAKVRENDLWGFITPRQELSIPAEYEEAGSFSFLNNYALVTKQGELGLIDRTGKPVLPFGEYRAPFSEFIILTETEEWCYRCLENQAGEYFLFDSDLNIMAKLGHYRAMHFFYEKALGLYFAISPKETLLNGGPLKLGLCDARGNILAPCTFQEITDFNDGLIAVKEKEVWGLMKIDGTYLTPIEYGQIFTICGDLIGVEKDGEFGVINREGEEIYACIYESVDINTPKAILLQQNGLWFFYDRRGRKISQNGYSEYYLLYGGWFRVKREERYGFANIQGKEKIACQYLKTGDFSEGLCWVNTEDGKMGFIDGDGKMQIPTEYLGAGNFSEGLAPVAKNIGLIWEDIRYGFIDANNQEVIPFEYEAAALFREGYAPVKKEGKWGFIKKNGKPLSKFIYDEVHYFVNGVAKVKRDGEWRKIDLNKKS